MKEFMNTPIMKEFYKNNFRKELLFSLIFVGFCFMGGGTFEHESILYVIGFFYAVAAGMLLNKYLSYPGEKAGAACLAEVVRYHSFDSNSHFKMIAGKLAMVEGIMAIGVCASLAGYKRSNYIVAAVLLLAIPALMFLGAQKYFAFRLTHEVSGGCKIFFIILKSIFAFGACIALSVYGVIMIMLCYAVLSGFFALRLYSEEQVAYKTNGSPLFIIMFIMLALFVETTLYVNPRKKCAKIGGMVFLVGFALCFMGSLYVGNAFSTVITENEIIHTKNNIITTYTYKDVSSFQVYMESDHVQMELDMKDGEKIKVLRNESTNTEAWGEKYYSVYNFLSDITETFLENGSQGSVHDIEKIRNYMSGMDAQCIEGMEEVIEMLN